MIMANLNKKMGHIFKVKKYKELAENCKISFNMKFYNEDTKCLFDVLGDSKIRPNQLFALSLTYPVVDPSSDVAKNIIKTVEDKLLNPYGLKTSEMNEVSKVDRSDKFENYHTSLIIYNPTIEKTEVNKVVSGLDILPSVLNLFGMDYDSRLLMGKDIFSETEGLAILSDRSWISDKGKYNSVTKEFTKTTNEEVSKEYIEKINTEVYQKFSMSSLILDNDYYKKIGL